MNKAKGLNIQKIILPIGNDGLNSEGLRMTTTKGTPQHDAIGWRETFRGYCELVVRGIDYLKKFAPVDVIVVSGNHDFERMFYAGDFIKGWYRNDKNVTVTVPLADALADIVTTPLVISVIYVPEGIPVPLSG